MIRLIGHDVQFLLKIIKKVGSSRFVLVAESYNQKTGVSTYLSAVARR
jgi:hypothetical protein